VGCVLVVYCACTCKTAWPSWNLNCACHFLHALTVLCAKMLRQYQQALANLSPCHPLPRLTGPSKAVWMSYRRKFPASHQGSNPNSSIIEPVSQSLYLLNYATGSCQYLAEMQLHRHGKWTSMFCVNRHLWIWHRAWCTHTACYGAQVSSAASCF
jgi:hypothetical protein